MNNIHTPKYPLKKSFVAYLDILGFSERFPKEKDSCIELLSIFAEHNGEYFNNTAHTNFQLRPTSLSFSDNISLSIPLECNSARDQKKFYERFFTLLHAISFFSYKALSMCFWIRGAIAYGEIYHTDKVIAGCPFIEAVENEKSACHPKIILAPSAKIEIMKIIEQDHSYYTTREDLYKNFQLINDNKDNRMYFDWLNFYNIHSENKENEIKATLNQAISELTNIMNSESDLKIIEKLNWLKKYLITQPIKDPNYIILNTV